MDKLEAKVIELIERMDPVAYETALQAARVDAVSAIVGNVIGILVGAGFMYAAWRLWKWSQDKKCKAQDLGVIGCILMAVLGGITTAVSGAMLLDPWIYVTLYKPELWLAKSVLGL